MAGAVHTTIPADELARRRRDLQARLSAKPASETPVVGDISDVSFHEAGHAVAEILSGSYPKIVYLVASAARPEGWDGRSCSALDVLQAGFSAHPLTERPKNLGTTMAAGEVANARFRRLKVDPHQWAHEVLDPANDESLGDDHAVLRALVRGMPAEVAESWLTRRYQDAAGILHARWYDVAAVAKALHARRTLTEADLRDLVPASSLPISVRIAR